MATLITTWSLGPDPGGGNPERQYFSPPIGANWTHLTANINGSAPWAGSFRVVPPASGDLWLNQGNGAGLVPVADPNQNHVTDATSQMELTTNSTAHGTTWTVQLFGDPYTPAPYCQYGTEPQPTAALTYFITPAQVSAWCTSVGMPWLVPLFAGFYFGTVNVADLCSAPPPVPGPIDLSTLDASVLTLGDYLKAVMWPNLCQCTPGATTPTPYPPPTQPEPPGWPVLPTPGCSNTDICTTLLAVQQQVSQIQSTLTSTVQLVTLMQRYGQPFAYIPGAVHSGCTAVGSFATSRLIGIEAHASFPTDTHPVLEGNPPYQMSHSWMAVSDASGLLEEKRIVRTSTIWIPHLMSEATLFSYDLEPGVVVDFTELEAEP